MESWLEEDFTSGAGVVEGRRGLELVGGGGRGWAWGGEKRNKGGGSRAVGSSGGTGGLVKSEDEATIEEEKEV